jgi:hypothetical protein
MSKRAKRTQLIIQIPPVRWKALKSVCPPIFPVNEQVAALFLLTIWERHDSKSPGNYTSLKAEYLRVIHRDYYRYIDWMIQCGVLECDNHFVIGKKSYGYRVSKQWRGVAVQNYRITNIKTIKAATRRKEAALRELKRVALIRIQEAVDPSRFPFSSKILLYPPFTNSPSFYRWVMRCWYNYDEPSIERRLSIVAPDYFKAMAHLHSSLEKVRLGSGWRPFTSKQASSENWPPRKLHRRMTSVGRVETSLCDGTFRFIRDEKTGRLHTPIANLPTELRSFLELEGTTGLTHIDVVTSQPYFLIKMARDFDLDAKAIREWQDATVSPTSDLYAWLGAELKMCRVDAKHAFIKMLFQHNRVANPAKDIFQQRFPRIAEMLTAMKLANHRDLALALQCYEAHAVLELSGSRFEEEKIPLLTIHDSFIVRPIDAPAAIAIVEEELTRFVGTPPQLRVTTL